MNELVFIKSADVFTTSISIAEGTGYTHHVITRKLRDYKEDFLQLGKVGFVNQALASGQKKKIYLLNEPQSAYLITLLENNAIVRAFKLKLVTEFYRMRRLLMEKQTPIWNDTRQLAKEARHIEADAINQLVTYAIKNGSTHAQRYYTSISTLVNKAVGINDRNFSTVAQLNVLILIERLIARTISEAIEKNTPYHEIYELCKNRVTAFSTLAQITQSTGKGAM